VPRRNDPAEEIRAPPLRPRCQEQFHRRSERQTLRAGMSTTPSLTPHLPSAGLFGYGSGDIFRPVAVVATLDSFFPIRSTCRGEHETMETKLKSPTSRHTFQVGNVSPAKSQAKLTRSRQGCAECRRRHRRCDEVKPVCGYCKSVGRDCNYTRQLAWGGRPFKKSRFGKCLEAGVQLIDAGAGSGM
jgi:hypothetical protein